MIDVTLDKINWEHGKGIVMVNFWLFPVTGEMVITITFCNTIDHN